MKVLPSWLLAGAFALVTAASALATPANRWFRGLSTAAIMAVAIAFSKRLDRLSRRIRIAAALLAVVLGLGSYAARDSFARACTASDASGKRVVIGTELTAAGKKYLDTNPNDNNDALLQSLGGLGPELAWTAESIERCRIRLEVSGLLWIPLLGAALVFAIGLMEAEAPPSSAHPRPSGRKQVFISYNHQDSAVARRLRDALQARGLEVRVDSDSMLPGERIETFIERSIAGSDAVVSIVSARSLLSSWVAVETLSSLHRQRWVAGKLFVCALLDDELFRPAFRLECTRAIDERLEAIERLLPEYGEKRIDTADLNDEKTRLYGLRNNLGTILANVKGSLCLDLRDEHFAESVNGIVKACAQLPG